MTGQKMQQANPIVLHELLTTNMMLNQTLPAIGYKGLWITYAQLISQVYQIAAGLQHVGLKKNQRVAIYLPNLPEAVCSYFSISLCGAIFVPINATLKARQALHVIEDCGASILITNNQRLHGLNFFRQNTPKNIILIDNVKSEIEDAKVWCWSELCNSKNALKHVDIIDKDIAAIFYTSGSTGMAKGVVLTHQNLVMGAKSVAAYLPCEQNDKMLAILPFSFDYGFSQLTIAFFNGASCYLEEFLFTQDVINTVKNEKITALALVPPLWGKLARAAWPKNSGDSVRYFCNSGGAMPTSTLFNLRKKMPKAQPFLMYGLTEAFRSCYLPPDEIDNRATSFGRAIPNAEVLVINKFGEQCVPFEKGELVHRGALVSKGYWNNPVATAEKFKSVNSELSEVTIKEKAVWSGDIVYQDHDGYFYFHGRKDDLIKSSGYRISPQEIEDVLNIESSIKEAIVIGAKHRELGQAVIAIVVANDEIFSELSVRRFCQKSLPNYMVPQRVIFTQNIIRNPNGKYNRRHYATEYQNVFMESR